MKKGKYVFFIAFMVLSITLISINVEASSRSTVYDKGNWKVYLDLPMLLLYV